MNLQCQSIDGCQALQMRMAQRPDVMGVLSGTCHPSGAAEYLASTGQIWLLSLSQRM